jgi:two-component sensor histidine kinase
MTNINIKDYIFELVNYLKESYGEKSKTYSRNKINFQMDIAALNLDVAQAIPLCLIINETVTNAIKCPLTPRC